MSNINKMIEDLIDISYRLADEKDYDDTIAPIIQGTINYLKSQQGENNEQ
jgi:hypothetical protein